MPASKAPRRTPQSRIPKRPATPVMDRVDQLSGAILNLRHFVEYCAREHDAYLRSPVMGKGIAPQLVTLVPASNVERWIHEFLHVDYAALLAERAQIDAWVKARRRAETRGAPLS
jgi:hypothetical protein